MLESNDPQDAFTSFHNNFINLYDKCFPIETIKLSYRNRKPWLTDGLRKSIKHKNKLYRLKMKYDTSEYCTAYKRTEINSIVFWKIPSVNITISCLTKIKQISSSHGLLSRISFLLEILHQ